MRGPATVDGRGTSRVVSLREVEAEALELRCVDLSTCRFTGIRTPERLRLTGCAFATTPRGVRFALRWPPLRWWTRRHTLADEHAWRGWSRSGQGPGPGSGTGSGQGPGAGSGSEAEPPAPQRLAALYSRLRAGVDDKATAADFAFGAMEMRRLTSRSPVRWLLALHWAVSGYGLRMGRMLGWFVLTAAIALGSLLMGSASHAARRVPPPRPPVPPTHYLP